MSGYGDAFIGLDTSKAKNAVAIAEDGRGGEVRYLGEFENTAPATRKLVSRLAEKYDHLHFCYEAGPTGYGLYRQIQDLGQDCAVVAPSLIPKRPGERIKTNRRDAVSLARLHRAGELTAVWVPDTLHEAVRDLSRARETAMEDLRRKRQQVTSFLLRQGRSYAGRTTWSGRHRRWLAEQTFDHPEHQLVLQEAVDTAKEAEARLDRLGAALAEIVPTWSMAPVVAAYQAMRGVNFLAATTLVAEVGDLRRFDNPAQLMSFLGLVPSEHSTGDTPRRGAITKTGNRRARRVLVEGAWSYRFGARVGRQLLERMTDLPKEVRDIAWKAQVRLCKRYRVLTARGKRTTVVATAVAREMAAFLWAIAQVVAPKEAAS
jgi:transposase